MDDPKNGSAAPQPAQRKPACEAVVGILFLVLTVLVAVWGEQILDKAQAALSKRGLLILSELCLLSAIYFGWKLSFASKWKAERAQLEAENEAKYQALGAEKSAIDKELQELKEKQAEQVKISAGVELRKSSRTLGLWMAFCPKCHTPLHPQNWVAKLKCPSGCGWVSPIPESEILSLIKAARETK